MTAASSYTAGQQLGFHYDNRRAFGEIICGLSIGADTALLLGSTNGGGQLPDRWDTNARVRSMTVQANAVCVLSGMSRYDLRHAVDHRCRQQTRYSLTFRAAVSHTTNVTNL